VGGEQPGRRPDPIEEVGIGEAHPIVVDAGSVRIDGGPPLG
jgi:hypothetical protein